MTSVSQLLQEHYNITPSSLSRASLGAGSDTWFVTTQDARYVLKFPEVSGMNHPENEPSLCAHLRASGIPACEFIPNCTGSFLSRDDQGRLFHLQRFVAGTVYAWNTVPNVLLNKTAGMLGRIHAALSDYPTLPEGIGAGFFRYMTPQKAYASYLRSLSIAESRSEHDITMELRWRIGLMERFPDYRVDPSNLRCLNTHGDYTISQLICSGSDISAVIDWTTACVHPAIWELMRSYAYAAPECANGQIDREAFIRYVAEYCRFSPLGSYDLECLAPLFYYQIAVCDYYGQYYASTAANRQLFLAQARLSTRLMRWFDTHCDALTEAMLKAPLPR